MMVKQKSFKSIKIFMFNILLFIFLMSSCSLIAFGETHHLKCRGTFRGKSIDKKQLQSILAARKKHNINLCDTTLTGIDLRNFDLNNIDFSGSDLSYANLQGANLSNDNLIKTFFLSANLSGANLQNTNMQGAILKEANLNASDLRRANLNNANLVHANLINTNLTLAVLKNANLSYANFTNADLRWADLEDADLSHVNLTNAYLENTNLTSVNLKDAILKNSNFEEANFDHAIYEPKLGYLPNLTTFHTIKNFRNIRLFDISHGRAALTELKGAYKSLGVRSMERSITAIIKYHEMVSEWRTGGWGYLESTINYIFFYVTCHFGASPGRPLGILLISILLLAIPYRFALSKPNKLSGIIAIWKPRRFFHWEKTHIVTDPVVNFSRLLKINNNKSMSCRYQWHLFSIAIFFSALSAFSIGWKQINVSNWISHLQSREYTLKGKGWVRILSGFQSIFSVFLIVLWVLTYFGSPFEW